MLLVILTEKKFLELFMKKNCRNQIKKSLQFKTYSREKVINHMSDGKAMVIILTLRLINIISLYKLSYFLEPYAHSKNKIETELN